MYRERESEKKVTVNLYGNNRLKKKEKYEDEKKVMIRIKKWRFWLLSGKNNQEP